MKKFTLTLNSRETCEVRIGTGAVDKLADSWPADVRDIVVIGDSRVLALFEKRITDLLHPVAQRLRVFDFPPGELSKNRGQKQLLEDRLLAEGFGRDCAVLAVGGGVSLDLAGFLAATYMRGVRSIYVPTSLLAQVDACLGGKVGVNTDHGKNLIGCFHQPELVIVDPKLLATLDRRQWSNGLAEMVKTAFIGDAPLFGWLEAHIARMSEPHVLEAYPVEACLTSKARIVELDPLESGLRRVLNFGHTVGHALEKSSSFQLDHGLAVAQGMVVEAALARELAGLPDEAFSRLRDLLQSLGLPTAPQHDFSRAGAYLSADKKKRGLSIRMPLPRDIGSVSNEQFDVTVEQLGRAWEEAS